MPSYQLVNPYIVGSFDKTIKGSNHNEVAGKMWASLSKYFSGPLRRFHFTLQRNDNEKLYHYEVTEKLKNGNISYNIRAINLHNKKIIKNFKKQLKRLETKIQKGGDHKHHKDDSSSSSSESDTDDIYSALGPHTVIAMDPFQSFVYYTIYDPWKTYFPTIISPLTPTIQIVPVYEYDIYEAASYVY